MVLPGLSTHHSREGNLQHLPSPLQIIPEHGATPCQVAGTVSPYRDHSCCATGDLDNPKPQTLRESIKGLKRLHTQLTKYTWAPPLSIVSLRLRMALLKRSSVDTWDPDQYSATGRAA